jgi:hypothetical protein
LHALRRTAWQKAFHTILFSVVLLAIASETGLTLPGLRHAAFAAPGWEGVPSLPPEYGRDVESWWSDHPFNPDSVSFAPTIDSPQPQVDVRAQYNGDIQAAIDALPASGGTLYFPAGTYEGTFSLIGRSHVHLLGEPGAVIRSEGTHTLAGCELSVNYAAFAQKVLARTPDALDCLVNNRIRDIYVKGLTFDGAGRSLQAIRISAAQDIVFDDVTLKGYSDPQNLHRGLVSGNASLENIWFRNVNFVGRERFALYLDGLHGGGVINSTIENGFGSGGLLFLTNDDFSRDYNGDGLIDRSEQRSAQYVVVYGNQFAGGIDNAVTAMGRNLLVKKNVVASPIVSLVRFDAKSSHVDARLVYEYTDNRVVENRVRSVRELVMISAAPDCPLTVNCARSGQYQVRKNVVETLSSFRDIVTETGPIAGPNLRSENCIAEPACP